MSFLARMSGVDRKKQEETKRTGLKKWEVDETGVNIGQKCCRERVLGVVVGEGFEPSKASASRFTVCPR
jgi:hypothetical protein